MASKEEINTRKVISSYLTNPNKTYSAVAKELNMPRTAVSDIIKRYRETKTTERKCSTGKRERGAHVKNEKDESSSLTILMLSNLPKEMGLIVEIYRTNKNFSTLTIAKKVGVSRRTVQSVIGRVKNFIPIYQKKVQGRPKGPAS
ncbi:hypothetical protein ILUMI_12070 [Ignelater luminosus]|uniref:Uncharacterized protein n=1 Tax=Ignelater luminosus TaxID=2038154 RepID=A0A8K0CUW8_IGNLU|nr:hypothetical protein ILUMI_12070 [Ignelater luminosus]